MILISFLEWSNDLHMLQVIEPNEKKKDKEEDKPEY